MIEKTYSQLMGEQKAFLTLKLDTDQPVEIRDFVGAFTSLANEFERFVEQEYPNAKTEPKFFVREVRQGCIEADLLTGLVITAATTLQYMDQVIVLEEFVKRWGGRFTALLKGTFAKGELESNSELKDWADAAKSIASDPVASHRITAMTFEDGKREIRAVFMFGAPEARTAIQNIDDRRRLLAKPESTLRSRVLMVFTRTDVHSASINKKSGERVHIRELSDKDRPVMYGSEMVESEIRENIREADENVYKKGFVVDVMEQMEGEKMMAYSVTALHSVIDLADD
jgi:hypothetical protein